MVADLPVLGTALPIVVTQPSQAERLGKGPLLLPSVGDWVKLRNVKAWVVAGQLQVTLPALLHKPVLTHKCCILQCALKLYFESSLLASGC